MDEAPKDAEGVVDELLDDEPADEAEIAPVDPEELSDDSGPDEVEGPRVDALEAPLERVAPEELLERLALVLELLLVDGPESAAEPDELLLPEVTAELAQAEASAAKSAPMIGRFVMGGPYHARPSGACLHSQSVCVPEVRYVR